MAWFSRANDEASSRPPRLSLTAEIADVAGHPMTGAGKTIGRYEIEEEIGRGSMGIVYRAYDPLLRRVIALKTILAPHGMAETALPRHRQGQLWFIDDHKEIGRAHV